VVFVDMLKYSIYAVGSGGAKDSLVSEGNA